LLYPGVSHCPSREQPGECAAHAIDQRERPKDVRKTKGVLRGATGCLKQHRRLLASASRREERLTVALIDVAPVRCLVTPVLAPALLLPC